MALLALACNISNDQSSSESPRLVQAQSFTLVFLARISSYFFFNAISAAVGMVTFYRRQLQQAIKAGQVAQNRRYSAYLGRDLHMTKPHVHLHAYHMAMFLELEQDPRVSLQHTDASCSFPAVANTWCHVRSLDLSELMILLTALAILFVACHALVMTS